MRVKDLLFKFSTHMVYNKYLYFDIEEFNPYGNMSIQINTNGHGFDVVVHSIFSATSKPSDIIPIPNNFEIKNNISDYIAFHTINYIFSDFIDDYRRVK